MITTGLNWARAENGGWNSRLFRPGCDERETLSRADLPLTLMHSPLLRFSVVALGLMYLTVMVFYQEELRCRESCTVWDLTELVWGKEMTLRLAVNWKCTLLDDDELQCFNMMNHSLTHSLWVSFFCSIKIAINNVYELFGFIPLLLPPFIITIRVSWPVFIPFLSLLGFPEYVCLFRFGFSFRKCLNCMICQRQK